MFSTIPPGPNHVMPTRGVRNPPPRNGKNKIYTGKNRGKEEKKGKTSEKRERISGENRKSKKLRKNSIKFGLN